MQSQEIEQHYQSYLQTKPEKPHNRIEWLLSKVSYIKHPFFSWNYHSETALFDKKAICAISSKTVPIRFQRLIKTHENLKIQLTLWEVNRNKSKPIHLKQNFILLLSNNTWNSRDSILLSNEYAAWMINEGYFITPETPIKIRSASNFINAWWVNSLKKTPSKIDTFDSVLSLITDFSNSQQELVLKDSQGEWFLSYEGLNRSYFPIPDFEMVFTKTFKDIETKGISKFRKASKNSWLPYTIPELWNIYSNGIIVTMNSMISSICTKKENTYNKFILSSDRITNSKKKQDPRWQFPVFAASENALKELVGLLRETVLMQANSTSLSSTRRRFEKAINLAVYSSSEKTEVMLLSLLTLGLIPKFENGSCIFKPLPFLKDDHNDKIVFQEEDNSTLHIIRTLRLLGLIDKETYTHYTTRFEDQNISKDCFEVPLGYGNAVYCLSKEKP